MNKLNKLTEERLNLNKVEINNRMGSKVNDVRLNAHNKLMHEIAKAYLCYKMLKAEKKFLTEAKFTAGGRPDIYSLSDDEAVEILCSETEKNCEIKAIDYPVEKLTMRTTGDVLREMLKDLEDEGFVR